MDRMPQLNAELELEKNKNLSSKKYQFPLREKKDENNFKVPPEEFIKIKMNEFEKKLKKNVLRILEKEEKKQE